MSKKNRQLDRQRRREAFLLERARARRPRVSWTWLLIGAGAAFLIVTLYVSSTTSGDAPVFADHEIETVPAGQDVQLPVSTFDDGRARFYRYTTSIGRDIVFFVMKSADGVIRAAFDACDVCYRQRKGYRQSGDFMVCNNCRRLFRSVDVNVLQGGCNPAPIERVVDGDRVVLKKAALDLGAAYF